MGALERRSLSVELATKSQRWSTRCTGSIRSRGASPSRSRSTRPPKREEWRLAPDGLRLYPARVDFTLKLWSNNSRL
jgi:hypothetical protein